jgi:hypothetical protein
MSATRKLFGLVAATAIALCVSSCASRPTVYTAPDASHVTATTKRLSAAIEKESATWDRAEAKVQAAQQSSDKIAGHSASVLNLIRELEPFIPEAQKPKFEELKKSADAQIVEEGNLSATIAGAQGEIAQGKKDHAVVVKERDQLKDDQAEYQAGAQRTAQAATSESAAKSAEINRLKGQLTSQKILKWIWRIGGGALVIGIIVLFVTGKISIAAIRAYFGR